MCCKYWDYKAIVCLLITSNALFLEQGIVFLQDSTFELFLIYTYNEGEEMEVHRMREKTFHVYVDSHDRSLLLQSLVELKNLLIQQGRYTDCVDELIFKVINAPLKKNKNSLCGRSG